MRLLLTAEPAAAAGSGIVMILYIVIIVAFMYFITSAEEGTEACDCDAGGYECRGLCSDDKWFLRDCN